MPKNKFQEVIFTLIMVFFMVYAMICYNISLNTGSMTNRVFLDAFHELVIMGPIAFILDFFIVSKLAFGCAMRMVDQKLPSVQQDPCDLRSFRCFHVPVNESCSNHSL